MSTPVSSLRILDSVYHGAWRFIKGCKPLTHSCTLYSLVNWSSLSIYRFLHWYNIILKKIGLLSTNFPVCDQNRAAVAFALSLLLPSGISHYAQSSASFYRESIFLLCPSTRNILQQYLKLSSLIPLRDFILFACTIMTIMAFCNLFYCMIVQIRSPSRMRLHVNLIMRSTMNTFKLNKRDWRHWLDITANTIGSFLVS